MIGPKRVAVTWLHGHQLESNLTVILSSYKLLGIAKDNFVSSNLIYTPLNSEHVQPEIPKKQRQQHQKHPLLQLQKISLHLDLLYNCKRKFLLLVKNFEH